MENAVYLSEEGLESNKTVSRNLIFLNSPQPIIPMVRQEQSEKITCFGPRTVSLEMSLTHAFLLQFHPWGPGHTTPLDRNWGEKGFQLHLRRWSQHKLWWWIWEQKGLDMRSQWPVGYKVKEWTLQNKSLNQDNENKWYVISHKVAVSESLFTLLSEDLLSFSKSSPRAEVGGHSFPLAQRGRQSVGHRTAAQTRPEEWTLGHSNQVPSKHAGTGNSWWRLPEWRL